MMCKLPFHNKCITSVITTSFKHVQQLSLDYLLFFLPAGHEVCVQRLSNTTLHNTPQGHGDHCVTLLFYRHCNLS